VTLLPPGAGTAPETLSGDPRQGRRDLRDQRRQPGGFPAPASAAGRRVCISLRPERNFAGSVADPVQPAEPHRWRYRDTDDDPGRPQRHHPLDLSNGGLPRAGAARGGPPDPQPSIRTVGVARREGAEKNNKPRRPRRPQRGKHFRLPSIHPRWLFLEAFEIFVVRFFCLCLNRG
jgi:hypothetical protein